jgi:collagenase-like PrtC family protease
MTDSIATEVFAYGRVPLAFSARCFTARARDLGKDDCGFCCIDDPDGKVMATVDGQPLLALNGIQTQSARPYSLAPVLDAVAAAGVDVLRISPQAQGTFDVVREFRDGLAARITPDIAAARIEAVTGSAATIGYWLGKPGLAAPVSHFA